MDVIGFRTVKIADLKKPAHWERSLASTMAEYRGESIVRYGMIHEPLVRQSDLRLIVGTNRVAGLVRQGHDEVFVKLIECDDAEAEELADIENLERRHDAAWQARLRRRMQRRYEEQESQRLAIEAAEAKPKKKKRGPKPKLETLARRKLAAELGVTADALRKQESRGHKHPNKDLGVQAVTEPKMPVDFDHLGMDVDRTFLEQIALIQRYIKSSAQKVLNGNRELAKLLNSELPLPRSRVHRLRQTIRDTRGLIDGMYPVSLCPFCKGLDGAQEQCAGCQKAGFITKNQNHNIPAELLDEEDPKIIVQGETRTVESWLVEHHGYQAPLQHAAEEDPWPW